MNDGKTGIRPRVALAVLLALVPLGCSLPISFKGRPTPPMTITQHGKATATIVVSADADQVVKDAVADLQIYIEKMSGAKLPIAHSADTPGNLILVGRTPAVDRLIPELDGYDLGPDGAVIKLLPGKLIITGKSDGHVTTSRHYIHHPGKISLRTDCGTPNAVYCFLESLGCRWYMPGEDGDVVPHKPTITVGTMDVVSRPAFSGRWISGSFIDGGGLDSMLGGDTSTKLYKDYRTWLIRNREGGNLHWHEHGMDTLLAKYHYAETHPEYYALIDGTRRTDSSAQFCMSSAEVFKEVARNLDTRISRQTPWRATPVGQYDGVGWCQCDQCRAYYGGKSFVYETAKQARAVGQAQGKELPNIAHGYLKFVNALAETIEQKHPNCLLVYYAVYNIPGFPEVPPRDNVMPSICHIAPNDDAWRRQATAWANISKQLYFCGYMGWRMAWPKLTFGEDIKWCHRNKGLAMYLDVDEYSPANLLPLYLATKTMWDTKADSRQILADFYREYYCAAEGPMRRFWETFDTATRQPAQDWDTHDDFPDALTPEVASWCRDYLATALILADKPVVKRRIESVSRYWRAIELHVQAKAAMIRWREGRTDPNGQAATQAVKDTIEYIRRVAEEFHLAPRLDALNGWLAELAKG